MVREREGGRAWASKLRECESERKRRERMGERTSGEQVRGRERRTSNQRGT